MLPQRENTDQINKVPQISPLQYSDPAQQFNWAGKETNKNTVLGKFPASYIAVITEHMKLGPKSDHDLEENHT